MMLAKVREQDGIMLANVKVPSIPTSAACCDDVQLTNAESSLQPSITSSDCVVLNTDIPLIFSNRQVLHQTASSKHRYLYSYLQQSITSPDCVLLNTDTSTYLEPSITPSDCVLLQAADVGILGTFTFASIIPSCSLTFASISPSCSLPFLRVIPTLFSFFFIIAFLLYLFLLLF